MMTGRRPSRCYNPNERRSEAAKYVGIALVGFVVVGIFGMYQILSIPDQYMHGRKLLPAHLKQSPNEHSMVPYCGYVSNVLSDVPVAVFRFSEDEKNADAKDLMKGRKAMIGSNAALGGESAIPSCSKSGSLRVNGESGLPTQAAHDHLLNPLSFSLEVWAKPEDDNKNNDNKKEQHEAIVISSVDAKNLGQDDVDENDSNLSQEDKEKRRKGKGGYALSLLRTPEGEKKWHALCGKAGGGLARGKGVSLPAKTKWQHLVMTYDKKKLRLFVDGKLADETFVNCNANAGGVMTFGGGALPVEGEEQASSFSAPAGAFSGNIAEAAVYAHALLPDNIKAHYLEGIVGEAKPGPPPMAKK